MPNGISSPGPALNSFANRARYHEPASALFSPVWSVQVSASLGGAMLLVSFLSLLPSQQLALGGPRLSGSAGALRSSRPLASLTEMPLAKSAAVDRFTLKDDLKRITVLA
jgi:hypothetical protein